MTTTLTKPVKRRTNEATVVRDRSKYRKIVVTLYPAGYVGLRLEGTRTEETLPLDAVFSYAVKARVFRERMEKAKGTTKVKRGRL